MELPNTDAETTGAGAICSAAVYPEEPQAEPEPEAKPSPKPVDGTDEDPKTETGPSSTVVVDAGPKCSPHD